MNTTTIPTEQELLESYFTYRALYALHRERKDIDAMKYYIDKATEIEKLIATHYA